MIDKELMIKKLKEEIKDNEEIAIALESAVEKEKKTKWKFYYEYNQHIDL